MTSGPKKALEHLSLKRRSASTARSMIPVSDPQRLTNIEKIGSGLKRMERETILRISDADGSWNLYTCSPRWARKFDRLFGPGKLLRGGSGLEWEVDAGEISIRRRRRGKPLTEEQKAAAAANLRKARG